MRGDDFFSLNCWTCELSSDRRSQPQQVHKQRFASQTISIKPELINHAEMLGELLCNSRELDESESK